MREPLHAADNQWWRIVHNLDGVPQLCLSLFEIGNLSSCASKGTMADQVTP
jgi:hypothetical protein